MECYGCRKPVEEKEFICEFCGCPVRCPNCSKEIEVVESYYNVRCSSCIWESKVGVLPTKDEKLVCLIQAGNKVINTIKYKWKIQCSNNFSSLSPNFKLTRENYHKWELINEVAKKVEGCKVQGLIPFNPHYALKF